jgi:hypothetical protein
LMELETSYLGEPHGARSAGRIAPPEKRSPTGRTTARARARAVRAVERHGDSSNYRTWFEETVGERTGERRFSCRAPLVPRTVPHGLGNRRRIVVVPPNHVSWFEEMAARCAPIAS